MSILRIELFGQLEGYRLGLEIQSWKLNFQANIGLSLLHSFQFEKKTFVKSGDRVNRYFLFAGLGPLALAAWMDP